MVAGKRFRLPKGVNGYEADQRFARLDALWKDNEEFCANLGVEPEWTYIAVWAADYIKRGEFRVPIPPIDEILPCYEETEWPVELRIVIDRYTDDSATCHYPPTVEGITWDEARYVYQVVSDAFPSVNWQLPDAHSEKIIQFHEIAARRNIERLARVKSTAPPDEISPNVVDEGVLKKAAYFGSIGSLKNFNPRSTPPREEGTTTSVTFPSSSAKDVLTERWREGARQMLATAVEAEVADGLDRRAQLKDENGHRQVVRNGHLPERNITRGVGDGPVRQPRVHDRRPEGEKEKFTSKILPPYLRKTKSSEDLIPWLYLKGISRGDFPQALASLLGPDAAGLSATTVTRLKSHGEDEDGDWSKRSLEGKQSVYVWDDGIGERKETDPGKLA